MVSSALRSFALRFDSLSYLVGGGPRLFPAACASCQGTALPVGYGLAALILRWAGVVW